MENEYTKAIERIADHVLSDARRLSSQLSQAIGLPESKVLADVLDKVQDTRPVGVQLERDKRATYWRARLRLFSPSGSLEADSDPELAEGTAGATVIRGLPGVAEWAGDLLAAFHDGRSEKAAWLDNATLQKKIKSLRPTLSRNHGTATWRIEYPVDGCPWKAFIEIEREDP